MSVSFEHTTVLLNEAVSGLNLSLGDTAIDCTAGGGGHTQALLTAVGEQGRVIAIDQDITSIAHLRATFGSFIRTGNLVVVQSKFSQLKHILQEQRIQGKIKGILADLGVSSVHLDHPQRGFSFMKDGPLDMRMAQTFHEDSTPNTPTAMSLVNHLEWEKLADIFWTFGEERASKKIAKTIAAQRVLTPITRTLQLAEIITSCFPKKHHHKIHPATKSFQALRMFINSELDELHALLTTATDSLSPKGRLGIISFHSLEDRIVKHFFKHPHTGHDMITHKLPIALSHQTAQAPTNKLIPVKPYPIKPSDKEVLMNRRSRSAILRIAELHNIPSDASIS